MSHNIRVVVTGMGVLTPIGNSIYQFWNNLLKGVCGADYITYFNTDNCKTKFACEIKKFSPLDIMEKKYINRTDSFVHYAAYASNEAIKDSNLNIEKINKNRIGVIWGNSIGGLNFLSKELLNYYSKKFKKKINSFLMLKIIIGIAAGYISMIYGFKGPSYCISSACTSSSNAIIDAFNLIKMNQADLIITGGSEAMINEIGIKGFNAMNVLSSRNESPKTASRPFDINRDGFVLGEGSGAIILESLDHAIKRNSKIYAELVGYNIYSESVNMITPMYNGDGVYNVMKNALLMANIDCSELDYINAHATSTVIGDIIEIIGISRLYEKCNNNNTQIGAIKSMTGHLLGASSVIESIVSILAIKNNIIPPIINHYKIDDRCNKNLNLVFNKKKKHNINIVMNNSFGFGGQNTSIIFRNLI